MLSIFKFTKLDAKTRILMVEEISLAVKSGQLYYSSRFNTAGEREWPTWLAAAAREHDEHWLAFQIEVAGAMKEFEKRDKPTGGYSLTHVPHTAAETFADGQFNRFYIAAICRRAIEDGKTFVRVYRAKWRVKPRPESLVLEGSTRNAVTLLEEVRSKDMSLKCDLLRANSGLSVDF